ncbi:MAG: ABC transporter substrate-binding protein [Nitrospinota bacterium]
MLRLSLGRLGRPVLIVFLAVFLCGWGSTRSLAADKVTFTLSWLPYAEFLAFFVALDRGHFREENIEVDWKRGFGTPDALRKIATGRFDYGYANVPSTAQGRAQGLPAVSIALLMHTAPNAIVTFKDSGISSPKDLSGRSVATTAKDALDATFPFLVKRYNLKDMRMVYVSPAAKNPTLLAGKAEALLTYSLMGPIQRKKAAEIGKEILVLPWSDYGYEVLGDNIASSDKVVRTKPDQTRRFLRAFLKGLGWAIDHPAQASKSMVRVNPMAKPEIEEAQWKIVIAHTRSPSVARHGLGYHAEGRVRLTRDTIFRLYQIGADVPLKQIYTNEYLPAKAIVPATLR